MIGPDPTPYAPLPQAPTAEAPVGMNADGAARSAWAPNVFGWVVWWRALITIELIIAVAAGLSSRDAATVIALAAGWTLASSLPALRPPAGMLRRLVLLGDLAACLALIWFAPDPASRALLAAYACSTVVTWAAGRPADAFIAGAACAAAFIAGSIADPADAGITGTLALFFFFALATSGFFTVAHRIGALEIATEISRERGRYRRDLHDRLGQALSGMHFEVQAVHAVGLDEQASSRLESLANGYHDALRMLRDLFRVGDEPMVGTNVASVIRQEARRMGQQAGVRVDVETTGDASRVPPWMRPHIVAVAGESVNNAVKNGQASSIDISIDVTEELVVLSITDDGIGFDNPPGTITEKEGHYGLREMAERARICNGEVVIASQPGFGTRVRLQAQLPDGAQEDILERDASRLRENVWSLLGALRLGLGAVAVAALLVDGIRESFSWPLGLLGAAVLLDVTLVGARRRATWRLLQQHSGVGTAYVVFSAALLVGALWWDAPAAFLLYAPLVLLGAAVTGGRRIAARLTLLFVLLVGAATGIVRIAGELSSGELEAVLVYVTDIALVGMAAIQGAKLLDRLETLQIRVRYQALARLRHGLSGRMRDQLTERLEELELLARSLSQSDPDAEEFRAATERMQRESTELKQRLREIVHTLADPTPSGRTPAHV
ncbi:MAG: Nitrate/nitrite sensor protein [Thermoleophilia bacterium]|nr:Nitrate/nitrite sensor protein [Thermoleophilia bacterium]